MLGLAGPLARVMRLIGRGGAYVPTGGGAADGTEPFLGNPLTSDPVRFARNAAVLEEEPELGLGAPTIAWADSALRADEALRRARPMRPRSASRCCLVAAGRDEVVSTPAIETFGMNLLAGRHLILAGPATKFCRSRISSAASSGRRSMPSYRARRCFSDWFLG